MQARPGCASVGVMRLDWATELTGRTGPFATVAVDVSRNEENAAHELELRWEAHARRLAELGAPDDVVKSLGDVVVAPPGRGGPTGRLAVATSEGVVLDLVLPEPPARESTLWGPVPNLLPAARARRGNLTYVLAEVDSAGAEISVVTPWGTMSRDVTGEHDVLHKVPGGGWSHRRYQMRVEDSIARNAGEVARALAEIVREARPDLVLLAGEEKSISEVLDGAPGEVTDRAVRLRHGSRAARSGETARDEEIAAAVAATLRERRTAVFDRFAAGEARQDLGGPEPCGRRRRAAARAGGRAAARRRPELRPHAVGHRAAGAARARPRRPGGDGRRRPRGAGACGRRDHVGAGGHRRRDHDLRRRSGGRGWRRSVAGGGAAAAAGRHRRECCRWDDASTPHDGAPSMPGHGEPPGAPEW